MLYIEFENELKKIEDKCDDNDLHFNFNKEIYPITATVKYIQDEDKDQMSMEVTRFKYPTGSLKFIFSDYLNIVMDEDFEIEETIFNSIKNTVKKLHYLWLQIYFKEGHK